MRPTRLPGTRLLAPLILWLIPFLAAGARTSPPSRLNLLLITVDTLRADRVSFYSDRHVRTPRIDGLAARGIVFTRAFSHCTTTLPAHANILLGTTPLHHGVHDNANFVVGNEFLTLAEHLKSSGYSTGAFIGGFPLESRFGLDQGFDTYDDRLDRTGPTPGDSWTRRAEAVLLSALAWLKGQRAPWFLWVHLWDPHESYSPPEPYKTRFADRLYDGEVAYVDAALGELFGYLERSGLDRSSLVVLTGDHGESLGEHNESTHGFLAYNATLWIPLIITHPGLSHRVVSAPVSHVDIFPTVCELLGAGKPAHLQGVSLVRAMKGGPAGRRPIYFESLSPFYSMGWAPVSGFIDKDEKFIDSPVPEVYDLRKDFGETANLAGAANVAAGRKKLGELVRALSSGTADKAARSSDRETVERLRSLGYVAASPGGGKTGRTEFGPEDDVKALLPFYNKAMNALSLFQAGRAAEAIDKAKAVIGAKKNISTAYLNLAHFCKEEGRGAEAASVLKQGLEALPENYYIFLEYVTCLYELGDFDAALGVFEGKRPPQVEFDPLPWNYTGLSWLKKGDEPRARECFEKALSIDGDSSISWYNLGNLDYFFFQQTQDRSHLEPAAGSLRKAAALDPTNGPARYVLGLTLYQLGDFPGAVSNLEEALALDPEIHEALYYLGLTHLRNGDVSRACPRLREYRKTPHFGRLSAAEKEAVDEIISRFCKDDKPS
ncbi:MAG TPA: sulfatase-like hydrolase/transferase [Candidatus Desulfaltia sp.]|nr:sulfatase-like hydrolase/transferase [Candidatus Desulfaltia sp.]